MGRVSRLNMRGNEKRDRWNTELVWEVLYDVTVELRPEKKGAPESEQMWFSRRGKCRDAHLFPILA